MDVTKKDMHKVGVIEEDTDNRVRWKLIICYGDH